MPKRTGTFVHLTDEERNWLREHAWQTRTSMSAVLAEAFRRYRKTRERKAKR